MTLTLLQRNFLDAHPYPVYLLYAVDLGEEWEARRDSLVPPNMDVTWIFLPEFGKLPEGLERSSRRQEATSRYWTSNLLIFSDGFCLCTHLASFLLY